MKEHIKRILKEETEELSTQDKLKKMVLKVGWKKVAQLLGGFDNLYRVGFNNDYNQFLNLFNNLDVVQSEEIPDWILYRLEKGKNIMVYDRKNEVVYFNHNVIWTFFSEGIGLKYTETQEIMEKWLGEAYNLRGVTPRMRKTLE